MKKKTIDSKEFFSTLGRIIYANSCTNYELCKIDTRKPYEEVADDVEFMAKLLFLERDLRIAAIQQRNGKCTIGDLLNINELFHAIGLMASNDIWPKKL